jgi:anthranilate synthase component II
MIVVIDNYDSFVFNLAQAFGGMGEEVRVIRNDAIDIDGLAALRPDRLVLSPGPGRPEDAGISVAVIRDLSMTIPTLGVCLGHQAIASAFGGRVIRADELRHGKSSPIRHEGRGILQGLSLPFEAGRYHSLIADRATQPDCLRVTAWTADGEVMGFEHRDRPLFGVQFHPESVLTPEGPALLRNFLNLPRVH